MFCSMPQVALNRSSGRQRALEILLTFQLLFTFGAAAATLIVLVGCAPPQQNAASSPLPAVQTAPPAVVADATPTNIWFALQARTPSPYLTPLPPPVRTVLDGTYAKTEPIEGEPVHCRRCPDYASDGGVWRLRFDNGIYRIFSELAGWRCLGSYTVSGERIVLFNDPICAQDVGEYTWKIADRKLILQGIKDDCAIHLRAENLMRLPWASCYPPNIEAAITDHWQKPIGCE